MNRKQDKNPYKSVIIFIVKLVLGFPLTAFFGLALLSFILFPSPAPISTYIVTGLFLALGIWLIYSGFRRRKLDRVFLKYEEMFEEDPFRSLERISAGSRMPLEVVKKQINALIRSRYYQNAYIDEQTDCLILPGQAFVRAGNPQAGQDKDVLRTIACESCGAKSEVMLNSMSFCEFCGTRLK